MSYDERKKKREIRKEKKEKRYKKFIIFVVTILLVVIILALYNKKYKTILAVEDVILDQIELQAVVIKDERIFETNNQKSIDFVEGERIGVGENLGQVDSIKNLDSLSQELGNIEKAISILKEENTIENNIEELENDYSNKINLLQENILLGEYQGIESLKKDVTQINENLRDLFPNKKLLNEDVETLNKKKEKLEAEIKEQGKHNTNKVSGIISYKVDGYENEFRPNTFEDYTFEKLIIPDGEIGKLGAIESNNDTNKFKIVDNLEWYLAIKIDNRKKLEEYSIGENLYINFPTEDDFIEIEGEIVAINNSSNKSVIVLKFNKYLHDFYNSRFPKVKLIKEKTTGLKIPDNVVIEKEGLKGVFIKDFSGIVKFKPIKVLAKKNDYTYIDKGNDGIISIGGEENKFSTVSVFDEILVKPYKYKDGQILE